MKSGLLESGLLRAGMLLAGCFELRSSAVLHMRTPMKLVDHEKTQRWPVAAQMKTVTVQGPNHQCRAENP